MQKRVVPRDSALARRFPPLWMFSRKGFHLRRGWCPGSDEFKTEMLEEMATRLGEHHSGHSGDLKFQTAEAKAERHV